MTGLVARINVSSGGVPKTPVDAAWVDVLGLEGDGHRDSRHHGGPDRAVCLYALEAIEALQAEGHPIFPGALGENLTVRGLPWKTLTPGRVLEVGTAVLEITAYTSPCETIAGAFRDGDFSRVAHKRHPGWSRLYARVLVPGRVRRGDAVRLLAPGQSPAESTGR
ncbi:MAG TPA: MOSC domain-containing protein [Candidatus Binatia bacterium]|nr:MOSC domain-containing protein [Candidatus Binatia bacterium]